MKAADFGLFKEPKAEDESDGEEGDEADEEPADETPAEEKETGTLARAGQMGKQRGRRKAARAVN